MEKKLGMATVIRKYFGSLGKPLKEFQQEYKALSDSDKRELAVGAAKELGLSQEEVKFDLS